MTQHSCNYFGAETKNTPEYKRALSIYNLASVCSMVFEDILKNSKDIDPAFAKTVDEYFWELI